MYCTWLLLISTYCTNNTLYEYEYYIFSCNTVQYSTQVSYESDQSNAIKPELRR